LGSTITNSRASPSTVRCFKWSSRIPTRTIAEILEANPNESSFLSDFFQKEAIIMKKIRCNDYDAEAPGGRKSAKSRLVIAGTFCCTRRRVIHPDINSEQPQIACLQSNDNS
jgi:hypothetical protein